MKEKPVSREKKGLLEKIPNKILELYRKITAKENAIVKLNKQLETKLVEVEIEIKPLHKQLVALANRMGKLNQQLEDQETKIEKLKQKIIVQIASKNNTEMQILIQQITEIAIEKATKTIELYEKFEVLEIRKGILKKTFGKKLKELETNYKNKMQTEQESLEQGIVTIITEQKALNQELERLNAQQVTKMILLLEQLVPKTVNPNEQQVRLEQETVAKVTTILELSKKIRFKIINLIQKKIKLEQEIIETTTEQETLKQKIVEISSKLRN